MEQGLKGEDEEMRQRVLQACEQDLRGLAIALHDIPL
jgi:hypothetical protein